MPKSEARLVHIHIVYATDSEQGWLLPLLVFRRIASKIYCTGLDDARTGIIVLLKPCSTFVVYEVSASKQPRHACDLARHPEGSL